MNAPSASEQPSLSAAWATAALDAARLPAPTSPALATDLFLYGILPYAVQLSVFFGCILYAAALDLYAPKWFHDRYKIKYGSGGREGFESKLAIRKSVVAQLWLAVATVGGFPLIKWITATSTEASLMIPVNIYLMLLIDEIYFYWFHRALHAVPYLWDKVHKIHHEIKSPTSITATYVSPIETNGVLAGSVLAGTIIRPDHFTFLVYIAFRTFTSVDSHSGWMLPFNPMSLGNAKNLSGVLALDSLFGTHSEFKPKNAVARDSLKVE